MYIYISCIYILASGLFLNYCYNFANFSLQILRKHILTKKKECNGITICYHGNGSKKWSRVMILIRTFNFRRFAFVSKSNSRPQRYNGISETDEVNPEENKLIQRLFVAP